LILCDGNKKKERERDHSPLGTVENRDRKKKKGMNNVKGGSEEIVVDLFYFSFFSI
jgi:hypothetical protein